MSPLKKRKLGQRTEMIKFPDGKDLGQSWFWDPCLLSGLTVFLQKVEAEGV